MQHMEEDPLKVRGVEFVLSRERVLCALAFRESERASERETKRVSFAYGFSKLRGTSNIHFCVFIVVFNLRASGNFS
jgi:hypothetical protein